MGNPDTSRSAVLADMSDEELMKLFQKGTVHAYTILFHRYEQPLGRYLYGFLGDIHASEDLLQETFLRVYRNRYSYRPIARFSTWLYTIAGNLARSEYRKRKRRGKQSIQKLTDGAPLREQTLLRDDQFAPDRESDRKIINGYILEALMRLPDEFREVVVLRDIQLLSYREAATITGLPLGTVKSRINRGRKRLQKLLAEVY